MRMEHTATPWHVGGNRSRIIYAEDGFAVADATVFHGHHEESSEANAAFIARACNAHDNLVTALQTCRDMLRFGGYTFEEREAVVNDANEALSIAGVA